MNKAILVLLLLCAACSSYAQGAHARTWAWHATQTTHPDHSVVAESTSLILKGREQLEWRKADGQMIRSFDVSEVIGDWPFDATDGEVRMEITASGKTGYCMISKSGDVLTALIVVDYEHPSTYTLTLQQ